VDSATLTSVLCYRPASLSFFPFRSASLYAFFIADSGRSATIRARILHFTAKNIPPSCEFSAPLAPPIADAQGLWNIFGIAVVLHKMAGCKLLLTLVSWIRWEILHETYDRSWLVVAAALAAVPLLHKPRNRKSPK